MPKKLPLAGVKQSAEQIAQWVERFHRDGYLCVENVLPPDWCAQLRADLDRALADNPNGLNNYSERTKLAHRLFETSAANLRLFDLEPIVSFAEELVAPNCHVIHNNSFQTFPGGGLSTWHQDDAPHYVVTDGEPPPNVHLPVLFFTANYYLTDVDTPAHGGTEVVPGTHLLGRSPGEIEGSEWEEKIVHNSAPAGSVVMFNNQVWHRGGPKPQRSHAVHHSGDVCAPDRRAQVLPVYELPNAAACVRKCKPPVETAARLPRSRRVRLAPHDEPILSYLRITWWTRKD